MALASYDDDPALLERVFEPIGLCFGDDIGPRRAAAERWGLRWGRCSVPFVTEVDGQVVAHAGVMVVPAVLDGQRCEIGGVHELDNQCPGEAGHGMVDEMAHDTMFVGADELAWSPQPGANRYQVARGDDPEFFGGCVAFPWTTQTSHTDTDPVPAGAIRYYLVRAVVPNTGSWGAGASGTERGIPCASP
jgi:hypothetical protein